MPTIFLARGPQRWVGGRGGTLVPIRDIQLTELDFGVAAPNGTSAASFWIRNVGDAPLTVREVSSLHNLQDSFLADNSIFPATLPPGGEKEVPCVFYGGSLPGKFRSSELRVLSDDPLQSSGLLNVKGRTAGPHLTEPNELLDLGIVPPNPASATITFRSDGTNPVTLRRVYLRLGTEFSVSGAPLMHAQLAPGTALTLTVTLTATQPGVHQDRLFVSHDGQGGRDSNILLKGTVE